MLKCSASGSLVRGGGEGLRDGEVGEVGEVDDAETLWPVMERAEEASEGAPEAEEEEEEEAGEEVIGLVRIFLVKFGLALRGEAFTVRERSVGGAEASCVVGQHRRSCRKAVSERRRRVTASRVERSRECRPGPPTAGG